MYRRGVMNALNIATGASTSPADRNPQSTKKSSTGLMSCATK
jgi:hypothetical protein